MRYVVLVKHVVRTGETALNDTVLSVELEAHGKDLFRLDYSRLSGGVAFFIKFLLHVLRMSL